MRHPDGLADVASEVHKRLLREPNLSPEPESVSELVRAAAPLMPASEVRFVAERIEHQMTGLGPLEPLLADVDVSDVLVNGPGRVFVERKGILERTSVALTSEEIELLIERIVSPLGLRVDRSSPVVDARLADGTRVNAVVPPLSVDGPALSLRRFGIERRPLSSYASPAVVSFLAWAIKARANLVVSGATGAGKTSLLNSLAVFIPPNERLVTIEDVAELRLAHEHVLRLESRPANIDGVGHVSIRDLVRSALRMRPDRLLVGEVRGPETIDMLQAMNTGHEGSLSTCHANSPNDALHKLETMVLLAEDGIPAPALREQINATIDLVVQVRRDGDGRRVDAIAEPVLEPGGRLGCRLLAAGGRMVAAPNRQPRAATEAWAVEQ